MQGSTSNGGPGYPHGDRQLTAEGGRNRPRQPHGSGQAARDDPRGDAADDQYENQLINQAQDEATKAQQYKHHQ